jgi:hypothetical protein
MRNRTRLAMIAVVLYACAACSEGGSPTAAAGTTGGTAPSDFSGLYSGTYRVTNCTTDGLFGGFCEGLTSDTALPIVASFNQNQSTITGTVTLGSLTGTFQGTVSGNTLTGTAVMTDLSDSGVVMKTSITAWSTTISGNALSGEFTIVLTSPAVPGSATLKASLVQLTR